MIRSRDLSTCLYQILPAQKLKSLANKMTRCKINRKSLNQKQTHVQQQQKDPHLTYSPIPRNSITSPECLQMRRSDTQTIHAAHVRAGSSTVMESIQCAIIANGMVAGVSIIDEYNLVRLQGRSIRTGSEERIRLPV